MEKQSPQAKRTRTHVAAAATAAQSDVFLMYVQRNGVRSLANLIPQPTNLILLQINKFSIDPEFSCYVPQRTSAEDEEATHKRMQDFAFDLVFSDGHGKIACLLAPPLNDLIHKRTIFEGIVVTVGAFKALHDEKQFETGQPVLLILGLTPVMDDEERPVCVSGALLQHLQKSLLKREAVEPGAICKGINAPLLGARGFYLPTYDDDNFDDTHQVPIAQWPEQTLPILTELARVVDYDMDKAIVMGRIHKKSKITHYAKRNDKSQFPMFFSAILVDTSLPQGVPIVFWNRLCLQYYHSLHVGDIIILKNYRQRKHSSSYAHNVEQYTKELSLNSKSPKALIYKVPSKLVGDKEFAKLELNLVPDFSKLLYMPDKKLFDLVGVVVNLTNYMRELEQPEDKTTAKRFTMYRYVTVMDISCSKFYCKLYTNSRKSLLDRLEIGQPVLMTDMQLHSYAFDSIVRNRFIYALSTSISHLWFPGDDGDKETNILQLVSTTQRTQITTLVDWANVNNFELFSSHQVPFMQQPMPTVHAIHRFTQMYPKCKWIFFNELLELHNEMDYLEARHVLVKANIKDITIDNLGFEHLPRKKVLQSPNYPKRLKLEDKQWIPTLSETDLCEIVFTLEDVHGNDTRLACKLPLWHCKDLLLEEPLQDPITVARSTLFAVLGEGGSLSTRVNVQQQQQQLSGTRGDQILQLIDTARSLTSDTPLLFSVLVVRESSTAIRYHLTHVLNQP